MGWGGEVLVDLRPFEVSPHGKTMQVILVRPKKREGCGSALASWSLCLAALRGALLWLVWSTSWLV